MTLLFFISFICLVVGLIKPEKIVFWKESKDRTKKDVLKYIGTLTAILFVLAGVFSNSSSPKPKVDNSTNKTETVEKTDKDIETKAEKSKETKKLGWVQEDKNWYYYKDNGNKKTGWLTDNNKCYYFNASGIMQKDWIKDQGKDYYLDSNGVMQTGWKESNGKWYYLNSNGSMATNTTVNGYEIASNGVMQEKSISTQSSSNSNNSSTAKKAIDNSNVSENQKGQTVYITDTGKKYHAIPKCGNTKHSRAATLKEAQGLGLGACSKCY